MDVYQMQLVKVGPSLRERAEQFVTRQRHHAVVNRLRRFREGLEAGMEPEPWTTIEAPAVTFLADICDALHLTANEKAEVLGAVGQQAQDNILVEQIRPLKRLNERQMQALVQAHNGDTSRMVIYSRFVQKSQQKHYAWTWLTSYSAVSCDDKAVVAERSIQLFEAKRGVGSRY